MSIQDKSGGATDAKCDCGKLHISSKLSIRGHALTCKNVCWWILEGGWIVLVIIFFVTTGTLNTLFYKLENETHGKYGTLPPQPYTHPFTQSFQMFLGMTIFCMGGHFLKECVILPYMKKRKLRKQQEKAASSQIETVKEVGGETDRLVPAEEGGEIGPDVVPAEEEKEEEKEPRPINQLFFMLPSVCDLVASTILSVALILTYASIYQMLQCITVVFTFFLSITILRHNFYKFPHKWIGVVFVFLGSMLVGLSTIVFPHGSTARSTAIAPFIGAMLVLAACFIYALFYIFEEIFLSGYDTDALEVPGYEGFWGFTMVTLILFVLYYCGGEDYGAAESWPASFVQTFQLPSLTTLTILLIMNIGIYNALGNVLTATLSCATRSVIDQVRAMLIWIIQLARGRQEFTGLQLGGFLLMVLGVFVYNEVFFRQILPCYQKWVDKINKADEEKKEKKAKENKEKKEAKWRAKMEKKHGVPEGTYSQRLERDDDLIITAPEGPETFPKGQFDSDEDSEESGPVEEELEGPPQPAGFGGDFEGMDGEA